MSPGDKEVTDDASPNRDEAPDVALDTVQDSVLLKLPLEVFQTITRYLDAGTFFASLYTCKQFLEAAKCRPNLIRHLYNLPGLRLGLEETSTSDLLLQFRKRAAESGCAAGVLADITSYRPTSRITLSIAAFSPANPSQPGSQAHLATVHEGGIIQVYDIGQHVRLKAELHIRPEDGDERRMEVVRVAFAPKSRDLAVLYHHVPCMDRSDIKLELQDRSSLCKGVRIYKLVTFHYLSARTKGFFYNSHQQETRDIKAVDDGTPIGLALAANGDACIAWKNQLLQYTTDLTLIGRDNKLMEACNYDCNPRTLKIKDPASLPAHRHKERQVFSMQFVDDDKKLNLCEPGNPIHSWYTNACSPSQSECGPILTNFAFINIGTEDFNANTEFRVGMPFHATHFENITEWFSVPHCQTSYLALGISRDVNESSNHPNAFVVQADCDTETAHCKHTVRLDYGRRLTSWKAVALLGGWRQGTSSLGTIIAISPEGTKVAAADWSRILIWSLDPKLLHQGELQHYFPIRDYNEGKGFGRLRPTLLSSEGVVYNMLWTDETCLCATTERGLVRWDLGAKSDGQRDDLELRYDAWPDTAVATPAVPHGPRKRILPW